MSNCMLSNNRAEGFVNKNSLTAKTQSSRRKKKKKRELRCLPGKAQKFLALLPKRWVPYIASKTSGADESHSVGGLSLPVLLFDSRAVSTAMFRENGTATYFNCTVQMAMC